MDVQCSLIHPFPFINKKKNTLKPFHFRPRPLRVLTLNTDVDMNIWSVGRIIMHHTPCREEVGSDDRKSGRCLPPGHRFRRKALCSTLSSV